MKQFFVCLLAALALTFSIGCNGGSSHTTSRTLQSITITPASASVPAGATQQFTATAHYSDGTTANISSSVTWSSSDTTVATISTSGLLTSLKAGTLTLTATSTGIQQTLSVTIGVATIKTIALTPAAPSIASNGSQQFTATATYTDDTTTDVSATATWASASPSVATIDSNGLATAVAAGSTTISATSDSITGSTVLTVGASALTAFEVDPSNPTVANGMPENFTAKAFYSDGTSKDVTNQVTWSSSAPSKATISSTGRASTVAPGSATIHAVYGGSTASTTLTVSTATLSSVAISPSNPQIAANTAQQFTATGAFSDGTTQDITSSVTWSSGASSVATINNQGLATGVSAGLSTITASAGSSAASNTNFTITSATLQSISVSAEASSIPPGTTVQFFATGHFSDASSQDLTNQVAWASSNTAVATIDQTGLATGVSNGDTDITATKGAIVSQSVNNSRSASAFVKRASAQTTAQPAGSGNLHVTSATLSSITVSPSTLSMAVDSKYQLHATGIFSDGTTSDLTSDVAWVSNSTAAGVNSTGWVTAYSAGSVTVQAIYGTKTSSCAITTANPTLTSLAISPSNPHLAAGTSLAFVAVGTYSNGTTQDLSATVTWTTSSVKASVDNSGHLDAYVPGTVTLTAALNGVTTNTLVTITSGTITSISVIPSNPTLAAGTSVQFTAIATLSDGTTQDVTSQVTWTSSSPSVSITANGLATATAGPASGPSESVTITATQGSATKQINLTLTAATLTSIAVTPASATVAINSTQQYKAIGTFSDSSTQDLTASVLWSSSTAAASISNSGLATGNSAGAAVITAAQGAVTSNAATLTVSPATITSIAITPANASFAAGTKQQFTATATLSDSTTQDVTSSVVWTTSNPAVATVSSTGLATGVAIGTATIQASRAGVTNSVSFTISPATLVSISFTPANPSVGAGQTLQVTATALFTDGSTQDVTTSATWTTSNSSVVTVSSTGLISGIATGTATITATLNGTPSTFTATVTTATVSSVAVTPANPAAPLGNTQQMTATATYSDSTTQNVTASATWTSSAPSVATVNSAGVVTAVSAGTATIQATYQSKSQSVTFTSQAAIVTGLSFTPSSATLAAGLTQQVTATATYSDNSTHNVSSSAVWTSSNTAVATVNTSGLITAKTAGSAVITGTLGSTSSTTTVTVTAPTAVSLAVTPTTASLALGLTQQLTATATYTDNSTANVSSTTTWTTSNSSIATVSSTGLVTSKAQGSATITGTLGSVSASSTITVGPATVSSFAVTPPTVSVAAGLTQQLTATATYTDGTTQNLSATATWTTSNSTVATISSTGLVTTKTQGSATITATSGANTGNSVFTVTAPVTASIAVTPSAPSVADGRTQQFTATATLTDNTTQNVSTTATWTSTNTSIATIDTNGLATTKAQGTTSIKASQAGVDSTSVTLTVTAPQLVSIAVTLANTQNTTAANIAAGFQQQYVATGTYTDGSTQDISALVNWQSSNPVVATVNAAGLASGLTVGSSGISATLGGVTGNGTINVSLATLSSINVTPVNPDLAVGQTQQLTATGTFSDNSTQDITNAVVWTTSNAAISTVSLTGLATAKATGTVTLTATSLTISGSTTVTVGSAVLTSLTVTPTSPSIALGTKQQFTATGLYSDGSTQDLTTSVTWLSQSILVAQINSAGLASSTLTGTSVISATLNSFSASSTLTVSSAQLTSITVGPPAPSFAKGTTQQFTASGHYTDGSTQDLTTTISWTSSNFNVATVNVTGLATGAGVGTATVTASSGTAPNTITGTATVTITSANLVSIAITPSNPSIALGLTQQFTATGTYSDSSTQDITSTVTWSSLLAGTAAINSSGLATSAGLGATTITARAGSISGTAILTVTAATLQTITLSPTGATCAAGFTQQFSATGHYTDSSTQNLTSIANWSSSISASATVSASGLVTCRAVGTPNITATLNSITGTQALSVTAATLQSITVTANTPSIALGLLDQMTATGHYSDGSTQNITTAVTWSVSNAVLAIINSNGSMLAVAVGNVTVTATVGSINGHTTVSVIL